jgi:hypothetical protein
METSRVHYTRKLLEQQSNRTMGRGNTKEENKGNGKDYMN